MKSPVQSESEPLDWQSLSGPVIGVDEVGRGCLAGRVYAAAVILTAGRGRISEYKDSKLLTEKKRLALSEDIRTHHQVGIGFASVEEIVELNILRAALLAMSRAICALQIEAGHVLVDGSERIQGLSKKFRQTTVVGGDRLVAPISAASIVAKVTRDQYITELGTLYPHYGFAVHKGYGTMEHRAALRIHGPCPEHRATFAGVKEFLAR